MIDRRLFLVFDKKLCLLVFSRLLFEKKKCFKMNLNRIICVFFICGLLSVVQTFNANEDIYFELYTQENPDNYQVIRNVGSIENTAFDARRPTRIFVHGFRSVRDIIKQYSNAYLKSGNFNFIAMNWIDGAETLVYPVARVRIEVVS